MVFNPTKADDVEKSRAEIREALERAGLVDVVWLETTPDDGGMTMAREAIDRDGVDLVIAWGGDGTVMSCVTAVAETGVPLAVLPAGTGNLLARNFAIPTDLDDAIAIALHGERRRLDVGRTASCCYAVMAGMGLDAAMVRDADPALKARAGAFAYVLSGLRHLTDRPQRFTIELDGAPPATRRGRSVLVANLGRLQGGLWVFPDARPDDGWLDVGIIRARTVVDGLRLAVNVLFRRTPRARQLETWRARRVVVTTDRPTPTQADGDDGEAATRFAVEVVEGALLLCVPEGETGAREVAA